MALLPLLGFPSSWEAFFQVVAGLSIVGLSVWAQIDKKLSQKAKAQMRARKAMPVEAAAEGEGPKMPEETPTFGKRITDFYPKTGQSGRRATDLKTVPPAAPEGVISEGGETI